MPETARWLMLKPPLMMRLRRPASCPPFMLLACRVVNLPAAVVVAPTVPLMLMEAVPVKLVTTPLAGVPRIGATNVGPVAKTFWPVPVSSVIAAASCAEVIDPKEVALPTDVTTPVKLALVVTLLAVKDVATPVMFVPTKAEGVPSAGATNTGFVAKTATPVPVSSVRAPDRATEEKLPNDVAFPEEVIAPVRLALVVTVAAFPLMLVWSPVFEPLRVVMPSFVLIEAKVSSPVFVPVMASSLVLSAPAASVVALPALPLTAPTMVEVKVLTSAIV